MIARKWIGLLSVVVLLLLVSVACQPQVVEKVVKETVVVEKEVVVTVEVEQAKETTFERAKREGAVRVGFSNEAPFAYANTDGTLSGADVEIARAVFKRIGIPAMEGVLTEWGALIPSLKAGRIDAITAGMYIKPERCKEVLFAEPEIAQGQAFAVKAGNPLNLHSYEDVAANPDVRFGVVAGGFENDYALAVGVKESQLVTFPDGPATLAGLQAKRIDAFAFSSVSVQNLLDMANDPNLERAVPFTDPIIDGKPTTAWGGTAFRKEDQDLRDAFSVELRKLVDSGELLEIIKPFGLSEQDLPGDMTTAQLCQE